MSNSPKVSIIMATFNRAQLIKDALTSVKNQTYEDWECIIIDDGGNDNTREVVSEFTEDDQRFRFEIRSPEYKKGLPGSRNQGLDLATGEFIIFFDDDDIVHPQNLQICMDVLHKEGGYFCRYDKRPFGGELNLQFKNIKNVVPSSFGISEIDKMITGEVPFASCGVMWRKECFESRRFNEELMYAEEWECYTRILASGIEGNSINEVLYFNRKHSNSNTGEFYNSNPVRRSSYIKAIKLVVKELSQKSLLSETVEKFLIRLGFFLKDYSVIKYVLKKADSSRTKKMKFAFGYFFYPVLRPLFILKDRITLR